MKFSEIRKMPTTYDNVHESVFRSYHILEKVKELIEQKTPAYVMIELINDMQDLESGERR